MNIPSLKTVSIFFILTLLSMSFFTPAVKGAENPYGENTWEYYFAIMELIHDNGTGLAAKRIPEMYDFTVEIVSESEGWAELRLSWEEVDEEKYLRDCYWREHDIPDVDNLTFMVKKSTNVAYFKKTDEILGFCPFYIYEYTDYSIFDEYGTGNHKFTINPHRTYTGGRFKWKVGTKFRKGYLSFSCEEEIQWVRYNGVNKSINFIGVNAKGHYPVHFEVFIPAEYIIKNVTTEEYVWLTGGLRYPEQTEAYEFLETINTSAGANTDQTDEDGGTPTSSSGLPSSVLIAVLAVLVTFSSIAGYLGYRKRR